MRFGWTPFDSLLAPTTTGLFDSLFDDLDRAARPGAPALLLDVARDGDRFVVQAEVPGLRLEDLDVTVHGRELAIAGERKALEFADVAQIHRERAVGRFERRLRLPAEIDGDHVTAEVSDGLLTVTLPLAEHARSRRIEVRAAAPALDVPSDS